MKYRRRFVFRPYRYRGKFKDVRVGTWVKWAEPGLHEQLSGQVWSRAPGSGMWWIVDNQGVAHKVHWRKFSPLRSRDWYGS